MNTNILAKEIWKIPLPLTGEFTTIKMPKGAKILTVQYNLGHGALWAECEPGIDPEFRHFQTIRAGHPLPVFGTYLGTYQSPPFAWHVYEI